MASSCKDYCHINILLQKLFNCRTMLYHRCPPTYNKHSVGYRRLPNWIVCIICYPIFFVVKCTNNAIEAIGTITNPIHNFFLRNRVSSRNHVWKIRAPLILLIKRLKCLNHITKNIKIHIKPPLIKRSEKQLHIQVTSTSTHTKNSCIHKITFLINSNKCIDKPHL